MFQQVHFQDNELVSSEFTTALPSVISSLNAKS